MASWHPDGELEHAPPARYGALVHAVVVLAGVVQLWRRWRQPGTRWIL